MATKKATPVAEFISTGQAAKLLGLSPRTVRQHADAGNLPGQRIGRDWLFRLADVRAFTPRPKGRPTTPP